MTHGDIRPLDDQTRVGEYYFSVDHGHYNTHNGRNNLGVENKKEGREEKGHKDGDIVERKKRRREKNRTKAKEGIRTYPKGQIQRKKRDERRDVETEREWSGVGWACDQPFDQR